MESHINLSYIREMIGDDPELVKDFVSDIISQIKETELLLHNFIEQGNFGAISTAAHKIKSIIQMVGAEQLYQKIQELEAISKTSNDIEEVNAVCQSVDKLSIDCRRKLEEIA